MYQPSLVEESQAVQELLSKHPHQCGTKTPELILLDQLIEVDAEQLKDQTQVLLVYECILESQQVVIIVLVELRVELLIVSKQPRLCNVYMTHQV